MAKPTPTGSAQSMWAPGPVALFGLMVLGSLLMWAGAPIFWLWFASRIAYWTTGSPAPSMPIYLLILAGIIVTIILIAKLLGVANRKHMQMTGLAQGHHHRAGWTRSMRDSGSRGRDRGLLEPIMFWSLGLALVAVGIFFVLNPTYVTPG